jgi:hypothetical protein
MSYHWLHLGINFGEIKRWFSPVQRLSWFHYAFAALMAYLMTWLVVFFWEFYQYRILSHPYTRFALEYGSFNFSLGTFLRMTVPAAINFMILLPFLRFPIRRCVACVCIFVAWIFVFWFFQAG